MIGLDLQRIAATYGGTVSGQSVTIPTPGHSARDRGTIITPSPGAPDGVLIHTYNGSLSEALAVKDQLRRDGFLPERSGARRELTLAERRAIERQRKDAQAERERQHRQVAEQAMALWQAAAPASPAHPYLTKKSLAPVGVRQHGRDLLVPVVEAGSVLRLGNLQRIAPDGRKLFLTGGRVAGLFWQHRALTADARPTAGPMVLAEGWATAAAIWQATGLPVVAAMSMAYVLPVAQMIRRLAPGRRVVVAADWDGHLSENKGVMAAQKAAHAIGASLALPMPAGQEGAHAGRSIDFADIPRDQAKALILKAMEAAHA
jgi:phage/plasmid primase-like uncharacterized protein